VSRREDRTAQPQDERDALEPPTGSLEAEGIPDLEGPLPSKEETGDGQDGVVAPGDRPWVVDGDEVTAAGQREGSTFDERLALEQPDVPLTGADDVEGLDVVDEDRPDDEPELVGSLATADEGASAEERAMHVRDDAPGGTDDDDDGYVADDGGMAP
jgi:hypothetical protein